MADTFNPTVTQSTGPYAGDYLWSTTGNWSTNALPASGDAVILNLKQGAHAAVVDGPISVASVLFNSSGSLLIGGSLSTGSITVASGVSGEALSVLSGGSLRMTGTLNLSGGTLDIAGTASINGLALNNTSLTIEGAMTVAQLGGGSIGISRGGTLEVTAQTSAPSLSASGDIFTLNGGSLKLDSGVAMVGATSFTFGTVSVYGTGTLDIANIASNVNAYHNFSNAINWVGVGDSIELGTATFSSVTYQGHVLTLTGSNGSPGYTLGNVNLAATSGTTAFSLSMAADGGTLITLNCFLSGTRIETVAGEVPIEALSTGDLVVTIRDGARVLRPVRRIAAREVDFDGMDDDAARDAAPVRIRAHAFAENVPLRDLLVTGDHCVFEAGGLVPARMLVNGASILRDADRIGYRVHHLEFDVPSILLSEGLTTESYLDTSGRAGFGTDANAASAATWAADAAAPLLTARDDVEPIWQRLAERAEALGMGAAGRSLVTRTTQDPAVRLRLAGGMTLRARRCRGDRYFFVLPPGSAGVTLQSRSAVPAEIEGPFVDDRRRLGVCVRSMKLWTDLCSTDIATGGVDQAGWHQAEQPGGCRWTDGEADFVLPVLAHATILEIELTGLARYPLASELPRRLRA